MEGHLIQNGCKYLKSVSRFRSRLAYLAGRMCYRSSSTSLYDCEMEGYRCASAVKPPTFPRGGRCSLRTFVLYCRETRRAQKQLDLRMAPNRRQRELTKAARERNLVPWRHQTPCTEPLQLYVSKLPLARRCSHELTSHHRMDFTSGRSQIIFRSVARIR